MLAWAHLFILSGWLPRPRFPELEGKVRGAFGPEVVVEAVGEETWAARRAHAELDLQHHVIGRSARAGVLDFPLQPAHPTP